jgi:hypothetical protein
MAVHYTSQRELGDGAKALVEFDMDSVRQMVAAGRDPEPAVWVVSPEDYESGGHCLRDSESIRLIGYVPESGTIYATDGCNSCRHRPDTPIQSQNAEELATLSRHTQLPTAMLEALARLASA